MQTAQSLKHPPLPAGATDAELAERAAKGDESAFERIMRQHNRLLFRTARSILKSDAEAEDALQEAYLRAWRHCLRFAPTPNFRPGWSASSSTRRSGGSPSQNRASHSSGVRHGIVRSANAGIHRGRRPGPGTRSPRDAIAGTSADGSADDLLPEAFRTVFMLRAVEELSVEEVADGARNSRDHCAHSFLSRSQSVARKPVRATSIW